MSEFWKAFMNGLASRDKRLYGLLCDGQLIELREKSFRVRFPKGYTWHQAQALLGSAVLGEVASEVLGRPVWFGLA